MNFNKAIITLLGSASAATIQTTSNLQSSPLSDAFAYAADNLPDFVSTIGTRFVKPLGSIGSEF